MNFFWSQGPRKSPPEVMSTSRETLCIGYILCGQNTKIFSAAVGVTYNFNSALIDWFYLLKIPMFFFQINPAVANTRTITEHTSHTL